MKILIFEFFTGGGMANNQIPPDILNEGKKILSKLLHSFTSLKKHQIITSLDKRIYQKHKKNMQYYFPADKIITINSNCKTYNYIFTNLLKEKLDAVLIVAPEIDNILANLTSLAEREDLKVLSSSSNAVKIAGDKWHSYQVLKTADYPQPLTYPLNLNKNYKNIITKFKKPYIIKPRDGAGSEVVYVKQNKVLQNIPFRKDRKLIIQEYYSGKPASVSAFSNGIIAYPVSLNLQLLSKKSFHYKGGITGINHPLKDRIYNMVKNIPGFFPGLKGYFGVDIIINDCEFMFIEINPRLTSSIIGLAPQINIAELIINSALKKKEISDIPLVIKNKFSIIKD